MGRHKWHSYTQFGDLLFSEQVLLSNLKEQPNGCITWQAGKHRQGYGMMGGYRISENKRIMTVAHRVAMMFKLGRELKHDDFVIHTCHDNLCCNPRHLILGDYYVKDRVMVQKGNANHRVKGARADYPVKKQANRKYKYTDEEILWIRGADTRDIAKKYNIDRQSASKMRYDCKIRYKWLT